MKSALQQKATFAQAHLRETEALLMSRIDEIRALSTSSEPIPSERRNEIMAALTRYLQAATPKLLDCVNALRQFMKIDPPPDIRHALSGTSTLGGTNMFVLRAPEGWLQFATVGKNIQVKYVSAADASAVTTGQIEELANASVKVGAAIKAADHYAVQQIPSTANIRWQKSVDFMIREWLSFVRPANGMIPVGMPLSLICANNLAAAMTTGNNGEEAPDYLVKFRRNVMLAVCGIAIARSVLSTPQNEVLDLGSDEVFFFVLENLKAVHRLTQDDLLVLMGRRENEFAGHFDILAAEHAKEYYDRDCAVVADAVREFKNMREGDFAPAKVATQQAKP